MTQLLLFLTSLAAVVVGGRLHGRQAAPAPTPNYKVIPVVVGSPTREKSLLFYPEIVMANPGDIIQFQFQLNNHTVTAAPGPMAPCAPLQDTVPNAMHSGFIPGPTANSTSVGTFSVQVENTDTQFLYCAQGMHCQLGMVMVVNPKSPQDLQGYKAAAMQSKTNVPAKNVMGGVQSRIPMQFAVPPVV